MHYYFPGMILGFILLQTAIITPTLSKKLEKKDFSLVMRALWPKFFLCLSAMGAATVIILFTHTNPSIFHYGIGASSAVFAFICYAIAPATNRAKDEEDQKRFNVLHKMSVYLTIAILLLNIVYLYE